MKDIIIVELKTKQDTRKNWFINLLNEEGIVCSFCEKNISENNLISCQLCNKVYNFNLSIITVQILAETLILFIKNIMRI